ncbi:MAG: winged helix-turn-helix domain-containing protein [Limisphaerales bacterium]
MKGNKLLPRFRVLRGATIALGPGKAELLQLLLETESLNQAAKRLDMSYMRAWKLVQAMNKCFREPLVVSERGGKAGGGMKLTRTGRRALELYQRIESSALKSSGASWRDLQKLLRD